MLNLTDEELKRLNEWEEGRNEPMSKDDITIRLLNREDEIDIARKTRGGWARSHWLDDSPPDYELQRKP